ncbi:hypothetical protein FRC00_014135 [Tulasnella sp. 408]|nr:hypothetical protein FRC00_014135 [Tulasnella sp. 408]
MLPSRSSSFARQATLNPLKRKVADGYESDDVFETRNVWRAFKKPKPIQVKVEQREPSPVETPSKVELPDAKGIVSLGSLPIDVFLEICLYLTPLDLLRLTRLTKTLRSVMLSSQGKYVWKTIYNAYFDTIIPGWPEPKMVSYLLDDHCDDCGKLEASRQWDLGTKLCPACLPQKVIDRSALHQQWPDIPYTVSSSVSYSKALNVYSLNWAGFRKRARVCLRSDVRAARKRFFKLTIDQKTNPKNEVRKKFIEELKQERKAKRRATKALKKWWEARDPEYLKIHERRRQAITERLLRDYPRWTVDDIPVDEFRDWVKIIKRPYPFSHAEYRALKKELVALVWKKIGLVYRGTQVFKRWLDFSDIPDIWRRRKQSHHYEL